MLPVVSAKGRLMESWRSRTLPKSIIMSPATLMMSSRGTTGMLWCCIIWGWIISDISQVRKGSCGGDAPTFWLTYLPSAFMLPKQVEMDGIVERIYTAMETQPHLSSTLLVLAGDHGMNDAGNHGGSGEGETSPALVFMSPRLKQLGALYEESHGSALKAPTVPKSGDFGFYSTVEQSDVAPTITSLLGLPVPRNNLGVLIPEFLWLWNEGERIDVMMRNARQLRTIIAVQYPEFERMVLARGMNHNSCGDSASDVDELVCLWKDAADRYASWVDGKDNESAIKTAKESLVKVWHIIFAVDHS